MVLYSPARLAHISNILLYYALWVLKFLAFSMYPARFMMETDSFVLFRSYASVLFLSQRVNAFNAFLAWFKIISYLSLAPEFALVTNTLYKSAAGVSNFFLIFMICMLAFSFAFNIAFGTELEAYATHFSSMSSLMKALLGDFDWDALVDTHHILGPFLFVLFECVSVFVILNLLIAIISEAYEDAKAGLKESADVEMGREIVEYMREGLDYVAEKHTKLYRCVTRVVPCLKKLEKVQDMLEDMIAEKIDDAKEMLGLDDSTDDDDDDDDDEAR